MTLEILTSDLLVPVRHGFFTRRGGASSGIFAGLNCGPGSGDQREAVAMNRIRVAGAMGVAPQRLLSLHQIHSAEVVVAGPEGWVERPRADAAVTAEPGIALSVLTADCAPVLFADRAAGVIGAAHAGWRGALEGVLEATILAMERLGATRDAIASTHRGHGHCVAKDADLGKMFAEFFGKETGYCKGRGGSLHIADPSRGNLGANGIVGGGLPIAVGAALSAKRLGTGAVTVCFFGDGANNEGAFHESLNMAAVWKLPVVFVCENNRYGMSTSTARSTAVKQIAERAAAYSMPGVTVDGNDFSAVTEAVDAAVARARRGEGPSLVENMTYRWRGHSKSDRNRYRTKEEIAEWMERDPIVAMSKLLVDHKILTEAEVGALEEDAARIIREAIDFAAASPDPKIEEATRDVYTEGAAA